VSVRLSHSSLSGEPSVLDRQSGLPDFRILEALQAAVIITDVAGIVTFWNPFAEKLYGWSAKEVLGQSIMGIAVSTETAGEAAQHMASLRSGHSWSGEFGVRRKSGEVLPALVTLSPLFDEMGAAIGIVGVSQDLRDRKQVENELKKAHAELETQVEKRTEELNKANHSLRDLSAQLLLMRDLEARRLARELHDSVGQLLTAISLNIATVESQSGKLGEDGAKAIAEAKSFVAEISREIRTMSHLLHPPLLDEVGLASALNWYIDGFSARSNVKVEINIPSDFGRLSAEKETAIFRIVQECLTNIHRHSGSKTARIGIRNEAAQTLVMVQDSGKGIPPAKLEMIRRGRSGIGFRGMAERVRNWGGDFEIESSNTGTLVTATIPHQHSHGQ
jgi:PAS domain S-box-containing protein